MYSIEYSKKALKDIEKLKAAKLGPKAKQLVDLLEYDPLGELKIFCEFCPCFLRDNAV